MEIVDFRPLRYTLTDQALTKALKQFTNVRTVFLSECRRVKFLSPIFGTFKLVVVLNLVGCSNLTDATLGVITMEMPKLHELYIAACTKLCKVAIHKPSGGSELSILDVSADQKITDDAIERVIMEHPMLKHLHLSQIEALQRPDIRSNQLELLSIDGCEQVSFETVIRIIDRCPNLMYLNMSDNDQMLSEKVKVFRTEYLHIVELNISAIFHDDETINTALKCMPCLRLLECSNSEFVRNPNFAHPQLEVLVCNMCYELQENSLNSLQTKLPNLLHLSCNHCDSLIRPMIVHRSLTLLDLSSCTSLLSDATHVVWLNCPLLKTLFLGHTPHLTDRELFALTPFISSVTDLNLYQASSIVEPNLSSLVNLEKINITNCWSLNQIWLDKLHLPKLQTIFINLEERYSDENSEGGDPGGW
eukprot:TRINITY_DN8001_c0_g1_i1.p1 TRINITY_DN8001_c0_g1~~TRINITY_DN8001_c0_g1_i1.p1  ORF type:complete len:490 (+),score=85.17 TRINITY_DN8001_c0_g1_i1:219-1472(+)